MGLSAIAFALNPYPSSVFKASANRCETIETSVGQEEQGPVCAHGSAWTTSCVLSF
jgi:hypothetical protein